MKIVADENIPYVHELFSPLGDVHLCPGRTLSCSDIDGATALLVRSVTTVNRALLHDSSVHAGLKQINLVKFVGTCTIGVDHLDTDYLSEQNIAYASAPGCNANAVVQYIISVLASINAMQDDKNVVIVGGGNVGRRVYHMLTTLGFECAVVDPFLDASCAMKLVELEAIYSADILCLHTPYTSTGPHPTANMFAYNELQKLRSGAVVINAGRGGVINNNDLKQVLKSRSDLNVILDVWANEPHIDVAVLQQVLIGTPHIAGYSFEGRVQGSLMIFDAFCKHFNIDQQLSDKVRDKVASQAFGDVGHIKYRGLKETILHAYNAQADFAQLKRYQEELPEIFDKLRKNYPKRREFSHFCCENVPASDIAVIKALGFCIND